MCMCVCAFVRLNAFRFVCAEVRREGRGGSTDAIGFQREEKDVLFFGGFFWIVAPIMRLHISHSLLGAVLLKENGICLPFFFFFNKEQ